MTEEEKKERNRIAVAKYRASKKGKATIKQYVKSHREQQQAADKKHYNLNKDKIKAKKLEYYHKNRERSLQIMSEYRDKYVKPFRGRVGTGNYNITLAERHKEKWLKEKLFLYHFELKEIDGTVFYKYGLTKDLKQRLYQIPYDIKVLSCVEYSKYDAIYKEKELLKEVNSYIPLETFGGHTECFLLNN